MIDEVLSFFPPHTHPLTLVSDPDGLLDSETALVELAQRGFTVIKESDPVQLRHRFEEARPVSTGRPVLVIISGPLEDLPYDLWEAGYCIHLSIHQYFPNLVYPVVQTLSPTQLERLAACPQPTEPLGRQKTIDYLLIHVFDAEPACLAEPHQLVAWLMGYHQSHSSLPPLLCNGLVERLKGFPVYRSWDLAGLLSDSQVFAAFIQSEWSDYIQNAFGKNTAEGRGTYHLAFESDDALQNLVPGLVRKRVLLPLEVSSSQTLPDWVKPGVLQQDRRNQTLQTLFDELNQQIAGGLTEDSSWITWKSMAATWAELNAVWYDREVQTSEEKKHSFNSICQVLDERFLAWLKTHYAPLGAQRLPVPKHVYHIPHYLAYLRSMSDLKQITLLVMDGLALVDWVIIQAAWKKRHPDWKFQVDQLLAQIPTITALSRYALISGSRPADFASDLNHLPTEARKWELFWSNEGLPEAAIACAAISLEREDVPAEIDNPRVEALCLVDDTIDKLTHNATLGTVDQQSSLRLWLNLNRESGSARLESLIESLLEREFTVFIASDHGHVEAVGFGQPSEGLLAQTRGKRARLYSDRLAALRVKDAFPETILWENDGLNPTNLVALMPEKRNAFTTNDELVVTHGGVSLDEVVVPLVQITRARSLGNGR
jgi:hypothetical protein